VESYPIYFEYKIILFDCAAKVDGGTATAKANCLETNKFMVKKWLTVLSRPFTFARSFGV